MAGIFGPDINSKDEFLWTLARARVAADQLLDRLGMEPTIGSVALQLKTVEGWTAEGRTPTLEERTSIDMGRRRHRAYEVTDDGEIYQLQGLVTCVGNYFRYWPSDLEAADEHNDDYLGDRLINETYAARAAARRIP